MKMILSWIDTSIWMKRLAEYLKNPITLLVDVRVQFFVSTRAVWLGFADFRVAWAASRARRFFWTGRFGLVLRVTRSARTLFLFPSNYNNNLIVIAFHCWQTFIGSTKWLNQLLFITATIAFSFAPFLLFSLRPFLLFPPLFFSFSRTFPFFLVTRFLRGRF